MSKNSIDLITNAHLKLAAELVRMTVEKAANRPMVAAEYSRTLPPVTHQALIAELAHGKVVLYADSMRSHAPHGPPLAADSFIVMVECNGQESGSLLGFCQNRGSYPITFILDNDVEATMRSGDTALPDAVINEIRNMIRLAQNG